MHTRNYISGNAYLSALVATAEMWEGANRADTYNTHSEISCSFALFANLVDDGYEDLDLVRFDA
jgi:hypothetical protein